MEMEDESLFWMMAFLALCFALCFCCPNQKRTIEEQKKMIEDAEAAKEKEADPNPNQAKG